METINNAIIPGRVLIQIVGSVAWVPFDAQTTYWVNSLMGILSFHGINKFQFVQCGSKWGSERILLQLTYLYRENRACIIFLVNCWQTESSEVWGLKRARPKQSDELFYRNQSVRVHIQCSTYWPGCLWGFGAETNNKKELHTGRKFSLLNAINHRQEVGSNSAQRKAKLIKLS